MSREDPLIQEIIERFECGDTKGILDKIRLAVESSSKERLSTLHSLTWPAPTRADLESFANFVNAYRVTHVFSVGCGTALLEWLMLQSLQRLELQVGFTGIEIDVGWWTSKYAAPTFLPLHFVDKDFDASLPFGEPQDMALFCYFNNLAVFLDYLRVFRGSFVAVLGPICNTQFCAPAPLELVENPEMPCDQWKLVKFTPFGLGDVDHLAIYQKVK